MAPLAKERLFYLQEAGSQFFVFSEQLRVIRIKLSMLGCESRTPGSEATALTTAPQQQPLRSSHCHARHGEAKKLHYSTVTRKKTSLTSQNENLFKYVDKN